MQIAYSVTKSDVDELLALYNPQPQMATPLHRVVAAQTEIDAELQKNDDAIRKLEADVDDSNATIVLLRLENHLYRARELKTTVPIALVYDGPRRANVVTIVIQKVATNPKMKVSVERDSFCVEVV